VAHAPGQGEGDANSRHCPGGELTGISRALTAFGSEFDMR